MLQISDSVGSVQNGSITAVLGSGMTSMSLAWIGCQPRIEEPSKPRPSSNTASSISLGGTVKCCQMPRKSLNFKSMATAFCSCINFSTSFGVIPSILLLPLDVGLLRLRGLVGAFLLLGFFDLDGIRTSFSGTDA